MKRRYEFRFSARVVRDVEFPDDCEEGSPDFEYILDREIACIDVDNYAECDDVREVSPNRGLTP